MFDVKGSDLITNPVDVLEIKEFFTKQLKQAERAPEEAEQLGLESKDFSTSIKKLEICLSLLDKPSSELTEPEKSILMLEVIRRKRMARSEVWAYRDEYIAAVSWLQQNGVLD